jgi:hypothetical protein
VKTQVTGSQNRKPSMHEAVLIGLIGGMSWESSAEYYRPINQETKRRLGGQHNAPSILVTVDFADLEHLQHPASGTNSAPCWPIEPCSSNAEKAVRGGSKAHCGRARGPLRDCRRHRPSHPVIARGEQAQMIADDRFWLNFPQPPKRAKPF